MEVAHVVEHRIIGRQVGAAAEPPGAARPVGSLRFEVAEIAMCRRRIGVARMQHGAHARRVESVSLQLRSLRDHAWRKIRTGDDRGVDAAFFKYRSAGDDSSRTTAADALHPFALPGVDEKIGGGMLRALCDPAFHGDDACTEPFLQLGDEQRHRAAHVGEFLDHVRS